MKKKYPALIIAPLVMVIALAVAPVLTLAQADTTSTSTTTANKAATATTTTPTTTNTGIAVDVHLDNPLKVNTVQDAIAFIVNTLIKIAIPFVVIFFMWSGLKFILAQGNTTKLAAAKKMFWYTVIGMLLIFGAWTITNAIIGTVNTLVN